MKYQKVKSVERIKKPDGWWVRVIFENNTEWIPSLYDLAIILNEIGFCESIKYLNGKGYKYTQEFINEIFEGSYKTKEEIDMILMKYDPNRKIKAFAMD